jgi:hypothetical protein
VCRGGASQRRPPQGAARRPRWPKGLGGIVALLLLAFQAAAGGAHAGGPPVIERIVDRASGAVLWSSADPSAQPEIRPGQAILVIGHDFGPGPLTVARPGLEPPAGGMPPADGQRSVVASPPEGPGRELSKVLFGTVRALERNLSSYRARIDIRTGTQSLLSRLQGQTLDYFVEPYVQQPETWAGDIYGWSDGEIDLTVPITAYQGPLQVIRIPVTGDYVRDVASGGPLLLRDPNTARVVTGRQKAFLDLWRIARLGEAVLSSNAVPVRIALAGDQRLQPAAVAAGGGRLDKSAPTMRSAADQYAYGEKTYWAWDWNLALPHFVLGVDWDGIFGFDLERKDPHLQALIDLWKTYRTGIEQPKLEAEGYSFPELAADGSVRRMRLHRALIDRSTGEGIRPLSSFGAVPLLPEAGAERLIAPRAAFETQSFTGQTPYPIAQAIHLPWPVPEPLVGGETTPTGWAGYVYAQVASFLPGHPPARWIGFGCAACHAARVTYQYQPGGKQVSRFFSGIPNPDWRATFLTLSGRALDLVLDESMPQSFVGNDYPAGTRARADSGLKAQGLQLAERLKLLDPRQARDLALKLTGQRVDKTLLLYSLPPGATEATLFNPSNTASDYANDYFFSPEAIPIITNHTPVRRALSRSELIDGFEGAYLHGEEPEGARGPMSSRSLQDLTLYDSTLHQDDELLRRIGMYRWLDHKGLAGWLGAGVDEGTFVAFGYPQDRLVQPPSFPPAPGPESGLDTMRDAALQPGGGQPADPFAARFPALAQHVAHGAGLYQASCGRCHAAGNAGMWTNEDMHPISAAGGGEPVGRYFSPTAWQRSTQSIRTAILTNLFWVQRRGLLSDGHVVGDAPDNMDGLDLLVRPERCQAPLNADGTVDLAHASDLYKRLYTIRQGSDHSFRIPGAGMRFELYTRFGDKPGTLQQIASPDPKRLVSADEARFVERHAYFTRMSDGYYYWDYQKMRREYGILEFALDPADPASRARIGGLPAAPHPWCMPAGATQGDVDDLVAFLLTL